MCVQVWQPRSGGDADGRVVVLPPDAFFPTWDPMQQNAFREHCAAVFQSVRDRAAKAKSALMHAAQNALRDAAHNATPAVKPGAAVAMGQAATKAAANKEKENKGATQQQQQE